ncbi:undecaprenyldiphospho-muramoylpentapeptide beta-N-acetylglucosaminyltransferase [Phormidium sp. CCY1219]|uniref:undecaprenyldiphospho-muramoylpentapeptide beta-N-acetylglucosaminyltransferase n=1 Tax=Phormidium sp. CCY1219 TaxID=2886104 RepID=UPI002D1F79CE|nr:undecaprenyldiphospho-muramoylpentapeptide beta-N-acetylglucosaminyltransferase [Phormidium sp. CCY1219]MEB3828350.1 undecaprenyldiphospho-muramoylpentapeptide beta-N-acetylglucosaminyltransferase [Phormidium sp. CCY1219]
MATTPTKLLIAASGTGGHLFPAIATAERLADYNIEWLGVPNRMETQIIKDRYPLHTISVEGFQQRLGIGTLKIASRLVSSVFQVRRLLKTRQFHGVFSTGGYIAAPAILAARSLGLPVILHESNALPGKVTRTFSRFCDVVAVGFDKSAQYLPHAKTVCVGTPVRSQFLENPPIDVSIPENAPLIVVAGGSQGAVAVNQLVRQCANAWIDAGAWIFHQTGENDPDAESFEHPHYISQPFYQNMAGLFHRATLAISRAGAGTLTELAVTRTPSILIPYPFAAEDHQAYNASVFSDAGAALVYRQEKLTAEELQSQVLELLQSPEILPKMAEATGNLAVPDSGDRLAQLVRDLVKPVK